MQATKGGDIPIFSANVFKPIGFHNTSNINDFNFDKVIWGIDGDFEFNVIKKCVPIRTTDHCGAINIIDAGIQPRFLMIELDRVKHEYGFDRGLRASLKNMKKIQVRIPTRSNGMFDIKAQLSVIEKYNVICDLKQKINEYKESIKNLSVLIDHDFKCFTEVKISDVFKTKKGLSKYTKKYGQANHGTYPVYSASNAAPLTYIKSFDYDGEYLTWATNGFAGYIKVLNEQFSVNGDRGVLVPQVDNIDIHYIKFVLEPKLREIAKGRKGDKGSNEFTKVYPSMVESMHVTIPALKDGSYDLATQQELADRYCKIEAMKQMLQEELSNLENLQVDIN